MAVMVGALSGSVFCLLRDLIHERLGVYYAPERCEILSERLKPLLTAYGVQSFLDYYYLLKEGDATVWKDLAAALAVNETYFWREFDAVQAVTETIVPSLQNQEPGRAIRIWSAGCASGEEPYTIAIALDLTHRFLYGPIEIWATDINAEAIARAREARYGERALRLVPEHVRTAYFEREKDRGWRLRDDIRERVYFRTLNLLDESGIRSMPTFDVIFCRNVFIYFSEQSIAATVERMTTRLKLGGHLFLGATESLFRIPHRLQPIQIGGAHAYVKQSQRAALADTDVASGKRQVVCG